MSETKITYDKYKNLLEMLNSTDTENTIVGLSTLNGLNHRENRVPILLLKKYAHCPIEMWTENAPKVIDFFKTLDFDFNKVPTYKYLLEFLKKIDVSKEELEFFFKDFEAYLTSQIHTIGYTFVKNIKIEVE